MFEVRNLSRLLLDDVTFAVGGGERAVLTAPSGSGKTVLLRALADLDPAQGEVSLDGRARGAFKAPEWRRAVAYVPSEPGWWSDRVGDHFRSRQGPGAPDPARAERLESLLDRLRLPAASLDWRVERASTGERQRLALARALEEEPRVLLLDEPTANLDGRSAAPVEQLLIERSERGAAVLLATHDLALARRFATRALTIEGGRVVETESTPDPDHEVMR